MYEDWVGGKELEPIQKKADKINYNEQNNAICLVASIRS
jgi:hypothetical protein